MKMRAGGVLRASVMLALIAATGCAPAMPTLLGGGTTPRERVDLAAGGAVRMPLGDLAPAPDAGSPDESLAGFAEPGGVAPVGFVRWGIDRHWAGGVFASSSTVRLEVVGETQLSSILRLVGGVMPYGGYAYAPDRQQLAGGSGYRVGALAPLALGVEIGGVVEGWLGGRVGFEHAEALELRHAGVATGGHLSGVRAGLMLGIGAGFRHVHALLELGVDWEWWKGAIDGGPSIERTGFSLTPGFALRLRF